MSDYVAMRLAEIEAKPREGKKLAAPVEVRVHELSARETKKLPLARIMRMSDQLPGLYVEPLASGGHRIRVRAIGNPKLRFTLPNNLPDELFMEAYTSARHGVAPAKYETVASKLEAQKGFKRAIGDMLVGARTRAVLRECECTITGADLVRILREQGGVCAVSGMEFTLDAREKGGEKRAFRMSVDRIDRSRGYTPDNIRITTAIANVAMMDWQFKDFVAMCAAVAAKNGARATRKRSFREECIQRRKIENKSRR